MEIKDKTDEDRDRSEEEGWLLLKQVSSGHLQVKGRNLGSLSVPVQKR